MSRLRVARWGWRVARQLRRDIRAHGIDAVGSVPAPPPSVCSHGRTLAFALRAAGATCLVRTAVWQRYEAHHGRPRALIIGVSKSGKTIDAHAWLDGESSGGDFVEIHRRAPTYG